MPMDIRKFFQKPASDKGQPPPKGGNNVVQPARARRKTTKSVKDQRLVFDDNDDDDDDRIEEGDKDDDEYVESSRRAPTARAGKKGGASPSIKGNRMNKKESAKKTPSSSSSSSSKKRPAADPPSHTERIEVSSADFFANLSQRAAASSSPQKKVKSTPGADQQAPGQTVDQDIIDLMEDDTFEPQLAALAKKKRTGTPDTSASSPYRPVLDLTEDTKPKSSPVVRKPSTQPTIKNAKPDPPLKPTLELDHFDTSSAMPECMAGYTFVCTGILADLSREAAEDLIKELGGRVTKTVSGKTDYLLVGETLEDGRPYTQGKKYQRAVQEGTVIIMGERQLYGLAQLYDNKARQSAGLPIIASHDLPNCSVPSSPPSKKPTNSTTINAPANAKAPPGSSAESARSAAPLNVASSAPAIKPAVNPYARATKNPYAKKAATPEMDRKPPAVVSSLAETASAPRSSATSVVNTMLWVDKYKPQNSSEILGNQDAVRKLASWLASWEERFNHSKAIGKAFSAPNGPWKAALLSGPPGIGKTTTATLVAREAGRDVLEFNASDARSKKILKEELGDITGSRTLEFGDAPGKAKKNGKQPARMKRCIIMDEVDGMGGGDRGGVAELIQMIKNSRVPIICICNDRQAQKLKSLVPYCMDLKYRRPVKSVIARRAMQIAAQEGLTVESNAAEAIAESCGNDVRQVLNCLQMWASNSKSESRMTYKSLKEREHAINKDEILRVSLFDAARLILEGRQGLAGADAATQRDSFFRRNDAYFVDYNFVGLIVQQNYLKMMQGQFNDSKVSKDQTKVLSVLERMHSAAQSMSDFAQVENLLRGDQNWSLLPFTGMLTVKTGFHASGENGAVLPGFPEFTAWLGKNSTRGKKVRILQELQHHMNFRISGGNVEMRLAYLPVLRDRLLSTLSAGLTDQADEAIRFMDEYGLDRDDVFERLDEFKMDPKAMSFADLDSKKKAAFTRAYNQGVHKSQALVAEQGGTKRPRRGGGASAISESADLDAIDDDNLNADEEEEEDEDDEKDIEKIKSMFQKKGRKAAAAAPGGKKAKGKKRK